MTEQEWLECKAPNLMFALIRSTAGSPIRRWLMFNLACCRMVSNLLEQGLYLQYFDHVEQWLERGRKTGRLALPMRYNLDWLLPTSVLSLSRGWRLPHIEAAIAVRRLHEFNNATWYHATLAATRGVAKGKRYMARKELATAYAKYIRCIFGNPFRCYSINSAWLAWNDGTIRKIAQSIYDDRAFDRMPILADALEDADCDNADILNHCRSEGSHVKGCWVVDALLGKE